MLISSAVISDTGEKLSGFAPRIRVPVTAIYSISAPCARTSDEVPLSMESAMARVEE